jgi:peptide/nickel transport system substrate-binding protein
MSDMTAPTSTSRRLTARLARGAAVVAVAALALSGCAVAQTEPGSPGESSAPVDGGVLTVAAAADAQPQFVMANRAGNWSWRRLVFDSLIQLDQNAQPQPVLATDWSYNDDRTELTMSLRDDVVYHSGRAFSAADVVYSLEQVQLPENASQLVGVAKNIASVEATSDTEVLITLAAPSDSLFDLLDLTPIVDSETWADVADGKTVVGTGPFSWEEWVPGASLTLEANDDYWAENGPYLDAVEISVIPDSTALQSALKGGAADLVIGMAQSDVTRLSGDPEFVLQNAGGVFYPFGIDVEQAPFNTPEARQALAYAIDRERINDQVFGGDAVMTSLWWTPGTPGYPEDLAEHYSYDPDMARDLLESSGAAGSDLTITFANLPVMKSLFEIVQNNLAEVGLNVTAEALDLPDYDKRQVEGNIGQSFLLLHGMVGFSAATLVDAMPSIRTGNPSHFATAEYDELKSAVRAADDASRADALAELSEYMLDEAFSNIIAVAPQYHVHSSQLQGIDVVSLGSVVATDAYLSE